MFTALAFATMFFVNIKVSFLSLDIKDAVITICGLLFGPLSALAASLIVSFLEMITVSTTELYGFLMNFISTAVFSCCASIIYKYRKRFSGAVIGLSAAAFVVTAVMILFNLLITPSYMNVTVEAVKALILPLFLPFNLFKALINSGIVLALYKPVSRAMRAARILPNSSFDDTEREEISSSQSREDATKKKSNLLSLILAVAGIGIAVASAVFLVFFLDGDISFF